jgi:hypothetical protein
MRSRVFHFTFRNYLSGSNLKLRANGPIVKRAGGICFKLFLYDEMPALPPRAPGPRLVFSV